MEPKPDRRAYDRLPMDFAVEITGKDGKGGGFTDNTMLQDVSGGGAKIKTLQAEKYFPGQQLRMEIYLPGTRDVGARMKGEATVVRTVKQNDVKPEMSIAVKFDTYLDFKRMDWEKNK